MSALGQKLTSSPINHTSAFDSKQKFEEQEAQALSALCWATVHYRK
jgi:hypothetical protein